MLARCAEWLVEAAVEVARQLRVPPILIGIVIVSVGTTTPELAVSIKAALSGQSEIALGNAVGSVIYDDGIALPLVALLSPVIVTVDRSVQNMYLELIQLMLDFTDDVEEGAFSGHYPPRRPR